jgi:hypothetical protein
VANRLITADEAAKGLLDAWNKAVEESGATPEEQAEAFNELAAWMGGFPPYNVRAEKVSRG